MKTSILSILLLATTVAFGQTGEPPPPPKESPTKRPRVTIPSPPREAVRAIPAPAAPRGVRRGQSGQGLAHNVTLAFKGVLSGSGEIDLELTGNGPRFTSDFVLPSGEDATVPPPISRVSATVTEHDGKYLVEYTVGVRVAVTTSSMQMGGGKVSRNVEYRDVATTGSVITTPGVPVTLSKAKNDVLFIGGCFSAPPLGGALRWE